MYLSFSSRYVLELKLLQNLKNIKQLELSLGIDNFNLNGISRLMNYGMLSCIEFYSCYLQQYLSIDLFSYWTPCCGQKGSINKVCPSCPEFFLELALWFLLGLRMVLRAHVMLCMTEPNFLEITFYFAPKMGNLGQA